MEAIFSSETSVETQRAIWRHIPEDVTACRFLLNLFLPTELSLEEAMDLSRDRQILDLDFFQPEDGGNMFFRNVG
jgi:hypothetical protein